MPTIDETRRAIRAEKLKAREALASEARSEASSHIIQNALTAVLENNWQVVHCYLSFRSEVDTHSLIEQLFEENRRVIVPWVESDGSLSHHELHSLAELDEGAYGIPHPPRNEIVDLSAIDAVFIPIAAFDREGNRLGYGKGFYDKFLSLLNPGVKRVGLAFAMQEAAEIPAMPHDVPLHLVMTENEIISTLR